MTIIQSAINFHSILHFTFYYCRCYSQIINILSLYHHYYQVLYCYNSTSTSAMITVLTPIQL